MERITREALNIELDSRLKDAQKGMPAKLRIETGNFKDQIAIIDKEIEDSDIIRKKDEQKLETQTQIRGFYKELDASVYKAIDDSNKQIAKSLENRARRRNTLIKRKEKVEKAKNNFITDLQKRKYEIEKQIDDIEDQIAKIEYEREELKQLRSNHIEAYKLKLDKDVYQLINKKSREFMKSAREKKEQIKELETQREGFESDISILDDFMVEVRDGKKEEIKEDDIETTLKNGLNIQEGPSPEEIIDNTKIEKGESDTEIEEEKPEEVEPEEEKPEEVEPEEEKPEEVEPEKEKPEEVEPEEEKPEEVEHEEAKPKDDTNETNPNIINSQGRGNGLNNSVYVLDEINTKPKDSIKFYIKDEGIPVYELTLIGKDGNEKKYELSGYEELSILSKRDAKLYKVNNKVDNPIKYYDINIEKLTQQTGIPKEEWSDYLKTVKKSILLSKDKDLEIDIEYDLSNLHTMPKDKDSRKIIQRIQKIAKASGKVGIAKYVKMPTILERISKKLSNIFAKKLGSINNIEPELNNEDIIIEPEQYTEDQVRDIYEEVKSAPEFNVAQFVNDMMPHGISKEQLKNVIPNYNPEESEIREGEATTTLDDANKTEESNEKDKKNEHEKFVDKYSVDLSISKNGNIEVEGRQPEVVDKTNEPNSTPDQQNEEER